MRAAPDSPRVPARRCQGKITVPIPSYLIVHPKGRVLFDSGLNLATQSDPESYITTAAILASVCDLMMLSVVLVPPAELWVVPNLMLNTSAVLGTLAIPFYAIGYGAIARSLDPVASRLRRTIRISGTIVGAVGDLIHAMTAVSIYQEQSSGGVWTVEGALCAESMGRKTAQ